MRCSNCRKQRVAIKCGRSEISRGIDYWSSFELKCGAPQTKKREKENKKNSLCIRNSENTAKRQEKGRKGEGKERENAERGGGERS